MMRMQHLEIATQYYLEETFFVSALCTDGLHQKLLDCLNIVPKTSVISLDLYQAIHLEINLRGWNSLPSHHSPKNQNTRKKGNKQLYEE